MKAAVTASVLLVVASAIQQGPVPTGKPTGAPRKSFIDSLVAGPNKVVSNLNGLTERAGFPLKVPTASEVHSISESTVEDIVNRRFDELAAQWETRLEEAFPVFNKFHHKKSTIAPNRRLEMFDLPEIFPWAEKSHSVTKGPWTGAPSKTGLFATLEEQVESFADRLDIFEIGNRGVSKAPKTGGPRFGLTAFGEHVEETIEDLSPLNLLKRGVSKAPKTGAPRFGLSALGNRVEDKLGDLNPLNLFNHGTKAPKGTGAPRAKAGLFGELGEFADVALHPFGAKTGSSKAPRFQIPVVSSLADKVEAHLNMLQGEGTD